MPDTEESQSPETTPAPASSPPPAALTIQDWEQRSAALEDRILGRMQSFLTPLLQGQQQAAAPPKVQGPSDEEIEAAIESGDSKKAAKLISQKMAAERASIEERMDARLGQATQVVSDRLAKLAQRTTGELKYYSKFKSEIDGTIRERGLDATDPEVLRLVHNMVVAEHMPDIVAEEVNKARLTALDEGEEQAFKSMGKRRRKAGETEPDYRDVPLTDGLRDELENLGYNDENQFALARGFKDPSGKNQHWNYMNHVGRTRERARVTGEGTRDWVQFLRTQKQHFKKETEAA